MPRRSSAGKERQAQVTDRIPTIAEQKAQGAACSCRGTDDYCPCQNVVRDPPPHWSRGQWCAPGDAQEDVWLIRFDDPDMQTPVFTGDNAEAEARAAWERHCGPGQGAYNGYLFRLVRRD